MTSPSSLRAATPPRVALVTCAEHPDLPADDRLLLPVLRAAGFEPVAVRWDDASVQWRDFAALYRMQMARGQGAQPQAMQA